AALTDRIWIDVSRNRGNPRARRSIERALHEMRVLSLKYLDRNGKATSRRVDLVLLAHTGRHWYLVAHCRVAEGIRWFRLDRVVSAQLTAEPAALLPVSIVGTPPSSAVAVSDT
ncbi:MAG: WYL domain-containing protein, partial [Rhodococcus sp. (in: high G+C Gram-positive bacteria)]|uniref:helix-turn-helix transcriptional regulator n=1 Tax=Rhodococcus sp. TaxID=1831 RepID=UPI003BAF44EF